MSHHRDTPLAAQTGQLYVDEIEIPVPPGPRRSAGRGPFAAIQRTNASAPLAACGGA